MEIIFDRETCVVQVGDNAAAYGLSVMKRMCTEFLPILLCVMKGLLIFRFLADWN